MEDYQRRVVPLAHALTAAAFAIKILTLQRSKPGQNSNLRFSVSSSSLPVFKELRRVIRVYTETGRFFPLLQQRKNAKSPLGSKLRRTRSVHESMDMASPSPDRTSPNPGSPLRIIRPGSAFSIDLSQISRSTSNVRIETERVKRMSNYCQSLEKKAIWQELKRMREMKVAQVHAEEIAALKHRQKIEVEFRKKQERCEKRKQQEERKVRELEISIAQEKAKERKEQLAKQTADDLTRSAARLSLSAFTKKRAEETKRKELLEKMQDRKDFQAALKSVKNKDSITYAQDLHHDLTFQLKQAVCKNQEIVKRIMDAGYIDV